jgi:hypothetical protein
MATQPDLVTLLDQLAATVSGDRRVGVVGLMQRLAAGRLRVAIVGEAKRGKSSLINPLLGGPVLPTGVTPVTAVATTVRDGSRPRCEPVHYRDTMTSSTSTTPSTSSSPSCLVAVGSVMSPERESIMERTALGDSCGSQISHQPNRSCGLDTSSQE